MLTQNSKMKKSSKTGIVVYNWTLPAFQSTTGLRTCPNAGACAAGCYARSGTYRFSNVARAHERNLEFSLADNFSELMIADINAKLTKRGVKQLYIRIHDAGDFYSKEYLLKWIEVMRAFEGHKVKFYAYTKQVELIKSIEIPENFHVIFSFGGKQDSLIDLGRDAHSRVFETEAELRAAGYINATDDDLIAAAGTVKVGLVYHGAKSYTNTQWSQIETRKAA